MLDFREIIYRPDGELRSMTNMLIIAVNIVVFILLEVLGSTENPAFMFRCGANYPPAIMEGKEYYRLFFSMFMHFGIQHLANNMLVLFFLGDNLERAVGKLRYLIIYLGSGLAGAYASSYISYRNGDYGVGAGASGAIFGVLGALFFLVIYHKGHLEELTVKRMGICIALTLYSGFTSTGVDNYAHVTGLFSGFLLAMIVGRRKRKGKSSYED